MGPIEAKFKSGSETILEFYSEYATGFRTKETPREQTSGGQKHSRRSHRRSRGAEWLKLRGLQGLCQGPRHKLPLGNQRRHNFTPQMFDTKRSSRREDLSFGVSRLGGKPSGTRGRDVDQTARWMYGNGMVTGDLTTSGIPPRVYLNPRETPPGACVS